MIGTHEGADYYRSSYQDYELQNSPAKLRFYMTLLMRYVRPGTAIFELGTGQGLFLQLAALSYRCSGCDPNDYGVERTRARVPGAQVHRGSVETLTAGAPYDAVVSWDVLEHLPDLERGLRAVHASLAGRGYLICVVPVYDGPLGWLVRLLDHDATHVTKEGRRFWERALESAGFVVVERGGILRKLVGSTYVHWTRPQWLLNRVGSAIYVVAMRKDEAP
jgi:SAM-dependent methyltransferase